VFIVNVDEVVVQGSSWQIKQPGVSTQMAIGKVKWFNDAKGF